MRRNATIAAAFAFLAANRDEKLPRKPPTALPGHVLEQPATLWAGRDRRPTLKDVELAYIRYVLDAVKGNQTRAAAVLGISRKALWEKRRRHGLG